MKIYARDNKCRERERESKRWTFVWVLRACYKSAGSGLELPTLCSISMSNSKLLLAGMYQAPPCTPRDVHAC